MPFDARYGTSTAIIDYKLDQGQQIMAVELDAIDAKILDLIQRDAALSVAEIAEKVGLFHVVGRKKKGALSF